MIITRRQLRRLIRESLGAAAAVAAEFVLLTIVTMVLMYVYKKIRTGNFKDKTFKPSLEEVGLTEKDISEIIVKASVVYGYARDCNNVDLMQSMDALSEKGRHICDVLDVDIAPDDYELALISGEMSIMSHIGLNAIRPGAKRISTALASKMLRIVNYFFLVVDAFLDMAILEKNIQKIKELDLDKMSYDIKKVDTIYDQLLSGEPTPCDTDFG